MADTRARVSVCSLRQAKKWKLTEKMFPSNTRLKPFDSNPIKVKGQAISTVTFGSNSVPVKWHIKPSDCEPILAWNSATALGIIEFNHKQGMLVPINMFDNDLQGKIQSFLAEYPHKFKGIGKTLKKTTLWPLFMDGAQLPQG